MQWRIWFTDIEKKKSWPFKEITLSVSKLAFLYNYHLIYQYILPKLFDLSDDLSNLF